MLTIEDLKKEIDILNTGETTARYGVLAPKVLSTNFPDVTIIKDLYKSNFEYSEDIDKAFYRKYKGRLCLVDSYEEWLDEVVAILRTNTYKYNELYETMVAEYNKMENYDMTETGTDTTTHTGTDTTTHTGTDTMSHTGTIEKEGTTNIGSQTTNETIVNGSNTVSTTNNIGATEETMTHKVRPFNDSDTSYISDSTTTENKARTDTSSVNNGEQTNTDSVTIGARSDKATDTEEIDTSDTRSLNTTDSVTLNTTDTTTHSFTRHGNIGVLSGQQLIEQSRNVANFNLWSVIFADINNLLLGGFI